jgi:hypothetical protein
MRAEEDRQREDPPETSRRRAEEVLAARPRRRRLPDRPEVELHAAPVPGAKVRRLQLPTRASRAPSRTATSCATTRTSVIEGMIIAGYAMGARRLQLHPRRDLGRSTSASRKRSKRRAPPAARQEHPRLRLQLRPAGAPRLRRLHLRRGNRAARVDRGQEGPAALQAAVPGELRPLRQADHDQQHRDLRLGAVDHAQRAASGSSNLGKPNNGGTKLFSVSGHVNRPATIEVPMGTPFKDCWKWRRHARRAQAEGGDPGRLLDAGAAGRVMMECTHGLRLDRQGRLDARFRVRSSSWTRPPAW